MLRGEAFALNKKVCCMKKSCGLVVVLACALWFSGCGNGSSDASCGLQKNCTSNAVTLGTDVITIPSMDKTYGVMIHEHNDLTPDDKNKWMIMIMHMGMIAPNQKIRVNTFSEDCGEPGDKAVMELTTDDNGMASIMPAFTHGGPWTVRVDTDASSTGDVWDDPSDVLIELCVPDK